MEVGFAGAWVGVGVEVDGTWVGDAVDSAAAPVGVALGVAGVDAGVDADVDADVNVVIGVSSAGVSPVGPNPRGLGKRGSAPSGCISRRARPAVLATAAVAGASAFLGGFPHVVPVGRVQPDAGSAAAVPMRKGPAQCRTFLA